MQRENVKAFLKKHRSLISYVVFGGLTTLVNIAVYGVCTWLGMAIGWANVVAWLMSVAFAYYTNRRWVFESKVHGLQEIMREIGTFVVCRLGTGLMDQAIMMIGGEWLGPKIIPAAQFYIWSMGLKIASNVLVIVLNYVFSKRVIFKRT